MLLCPLNKSPIKTSWDDGGIQPHNQTTANKTGALGEQQYTGKLDMMNVCYQHNQPINSIGGHKLVELVQVFGILEW